jgi:hypothetical protein
MNAVPLQIETDRLILHCPTLEDGAAVNEAIRESLPELSFWMEWATGEPPSVEDTTERVGSREKGFIDRTDFSYAAFERESGRFAGMFSLFEFDWSVPKGEIGYWLRTGATGLGFATEATLAHKAGTRDAESRPNRNSLRRVQRPLPRRGRAGGLRARRRSEKRVSQSARSAPRHLRLLPARLTDFVSSIQ